MKAIFKIIKRLHCILERKQFKQLLIIQVQLVLMGFAELIGLSLIIPFATLLTEPSKIFQNQYFRSIFIFLNIDSEREVVFAIGGAAFIAFLVSNIIVLYTTRSLTYFGQNVGQGLAVKLFKKYINSNYIFHTINNSGDLTSNILLETNRTTFHVIIPLLIINQRLVIILTIGLLMLITYPLIVLSVGSSICLIYFVIYNLVRAKVIRNGDALTHNNPERVKLLNEAFSGIKEVKLRQNEEQFISRFSVASNNIANATASSTFIGVCPRFFLEMLVFCSGIIFLLIAYARGVDINGLIPIISFFAICTLRLLPSFQLVFSSLTAIRNSVNAFWKISDEIIDDEKEKPLTKFEENRFLFDKLTVSDLSFKYPGERQYALKDIKFSIDQGSSVAFVGESGSGKTTLINILVGLLKHDTGELYLDEKSFDSDVMVSEWSKTIGYVAQDIYLSDRSVAENIAFGTEKQDIDLDKVKKCAQNACLDEFIDSLKDGYDEIIGEAGVQLSGGQIQRIAIARALYHDPSIIVFDEGTSALDSITERKIIESLENLQKNQTILMVAHRLTTVKNCDKIYLMKSGQIIDSGTYSELRKRNPIFKSMSK